MPLTRVHLQGHGQGLPVPIPYDLGHWVPVAAGAGGYLGQTRALTGLGARTLESGSPSLGVGGEPDQTQTQPNPLLPGVPRSELLDPYSSDWEA